MDKVRGTSPDLIAAHIDRLGELFPGVVIEVLDADGAPTRAVDFDLLRQELAEHVVEGPVERYQLDWPGKRGAAFTANAATARSLRPARDESMAFDTTRNLFIEGDNLDALKLLLESYLGKVKLIYIDPPYNTGRDFVYNDAFATTAREYLERSSQVDDHGGRLVTNLDSNGRFHSDWLSMMYPRLRLARSLLSDDGVLAISIDDNELARLIQLGTEVFGEASLLNIVVVKSSEASGVKMSHADRRLPKMREFLVLFARNRAAVSMTPIRRQKSSSEAGELDAYLKYYGQFILDPSAPVDQWVIQRVVDVMRDRGLGTSADEVRTFKLEHASQVVYRTNNASLSALEFPTSTAEVISATGLRYIWWEGKQMLFLADYLQETLGDLWVDLSTINLNKETLGVEGFGQGQKPLALLDRLLTLFTSGTDPVVVMDFFAGSGTTGHAVLKRNAEDGGQRRFILVQIPEPLERRNQEHAKAIATCEEIGVPLTIAELTKERLRKAAAEHPGTGSGFRVLKVDSSNMTDVWRTPENTDQDLLSELRDSVKPDRSADDLLFQVLLDWGLEPSMRVDVEELEGHQLLIVEDEAVIACFDSDVPLGLVRGIAQRAPLRAVFRDSSFASDGARVNAEQVFRELSPTTDVRTV